MVMLISPFRYFCRMQRMPQVSDDVIRRDPIGAAIFDYYHSGKDAKIQVFINGKRDEDMLSSLFFRNYQQMKGYERLALRYAKGSVLDVGAGAGCHSLILQKRKLDVTAIERSSLACEVLRQRGVKRILNEDIFDLRGIPYNTILLLMNGLGLMGSEEETLKLLKHLKRLLAPKGYIIGDSTDILYNTMNAEQAFNSKADYYGKVEFKLKYKGIQADPFDWIYIDPVLLTELADKAGLHCDIIHRDSNFHYLAKLRAV
jgi:SAM-dependent methyltransferase